MFDESQDAVFLPGKIHGCDYQVYIIYQNEQANEGKGSWEIEVIDCFRILKLYEEANGDANTFLNCCRICFTKNGDIVIKEWMDMTNLKAPTLQPILLYAEMVIYKMNLISLLVGREHLFRRLFLWQRC